MSSQVFVISRVIFHVLSLAISPSCKKECSNCESNNKCKELKEKLLAAQSTPASFRLLSHERSRTLGWNAVGSLQPPTANHIFPKLRPSDTAIANAKLPSRLFPPDQIHLRRHSTVNPHLSPSFLLFTFLLVLSFWKNWIPWSWLHSALLWLNCRYFTFGRVEVSLALVLHVAAWLH